MKNVKSPEIVALENRIVELSKAFQLLRADTAQAAFAEFAPHQKAISLLMPKIMAADKDASITLTFTAEEQIIFKDAAVAA